MKTNLTQNKWYPKGQDENEYSPLRKLREKDKIYFFNLRDKELKGALDPYDPGDIFHKRGYDEFTSHAKKLNDAQKQLLDLQVQNLAKDKFYNGLNFSFHSLDKVPEKFTAGLYVPSEKATKIDMNIAHNPESNRAETMIHENQHALSYSPILRHHEEQKKLGPTKAKMIDKVPKTSPFFTMEDYFDKNKHSITDNSQQQDIIKGMQNILDDNSHKNSVIDEESGSYAKFYPADKVKVMYEPNWLEDDLNSPDEMNAHFMERYHRPIQPSSNSRSNSLLRNAASNLQTFYQNMPRYGEYDLIDQMFNKRIAELNKPYQPLLPGGLGMGTSQLQIQQNPLSQLSSGPVIAHIDESGNVVYKSEESKDNYATGGSISSGLGSLYDYLNHRYAGGGGVGLGGMGRFFGLYPSGYYPDY